MINLNPQRDNQEAGDPETGETQADKFPEQILRYSYVP